MNLLERVQPLLGELAGKITELVDELVREGIRDRLSAVLEDIGDRDLKPSKMIRKTAKRRAAPPRAAKTAAKPRGGSQPCGICHETGHNRRTCPDREQPDPPTAPKVAPPIATKPAVVVAKAPPKCRDEARSLRAHLGCSRPSQRSRRVIPTRSLLS